MVVSVNDQPRPACLRQAIDDGETVRMAGWGFVGDQNVAAQSGQTVEILRKDSVAVEQRQATAPRFVRAQASLEVSSGVI